MSRIDLYADKHKSKAVSPYNKRLSNNELILDVDLKPQD